MTSKAPEVASAETSYRQITPEMIEHERRRVGKPLSFVQPHIEVATKDAIRHWAHGTGDRNPLWTDEAYAKETRWGGILAPPSIVMALDRNILGASMRGFPGIHSWQLGNSFEWHRPIHVDTRAAGETVIESLEPVESNYAGGLAVDQTVRMDLRDRDSGELLCVARTYIRRFGRRSGAKTGKYKGRTKQVYSRDELQEIANLYAAEEIRGRTPRHVEDVEVGQQLPMLVRGPLTLADCIAFNIGWGGAYIFAHGFAWDFIGKHPGAFPPDASNVPDTPERTHYVDEFAQAVGAPAAFDYGPQRVTWTQTLCTNWAGDDGVLVRNRVQLLRPNYHGDIVYLHGTVTAVDAGSGEVDIEIAGRNQLDELVVTATATVRLPNRA
jgi:acyl dehydratase